MKKNKRQISQISSKSSDSDKDNSGGVNKSYDDKINQLEDSIITNNATCSSGNISNTSFQGSQIITIKLYYYIRNDLKNIDILISEDKTIKDLIIFSLNIINEQLDSDKLNIQLDMKDYNNYCIKLLEKLDELKNSRNIPPLSMDSALINYFYTDAIFLLVWLEENKSNVLPYHRNIEKKKREINKIKILQNNMGRNKINNVRKNNTYNNELNGNDDNCGVF